MKASSLIIVALSALAGSVNGRTDVELLATAKDAWAARIAADIYRHPEEAAKAFREKFGGHSDSEKIKALFLYLNDVDSGDSRWAMSAYTPMRFNRIIESDPTFIQNWTSLGPLLSKETEPRRFYLLSRMVPRNTAIEYRGFISERTHMLFRSGKIAKDEFEMTYENAHDVSAYTYDSIVGKLRTLEAGFSPPANSLPLEERKLILAKWLKANWPGCENLEIPASLTVPRSDADNGSRAVKGPDRVNQAPEIKAGKGDSGTSLQSNRLLWFAAGALLVIGVIFVRRFLKRG